MIRGILGNAVIIAASVVSLGLLLAVPGEGQQPPLALPVPNACGGPDGVPSCKDRDRDGLCDSWELAKHLPNGIPLPDADPDKPDIYVQYDWLGYGDTQNACSVDSDCPALWGNLGHAGETCSGPAIPGSAKSCAYACVVDMQCTSRGPSHVGERCIENRCQHAHDPLVVAPEALDAVVESFALRGFNLHIVRGIEVPHSHVLSYRLLDDPYHTENTVTDTCEGGSLASSTAGAGKYAESLYDLKATSFDAGRGLAYHYAVFAHYNTCDNDAHCANCPAPTIGLNPDGSPKVATPVFGQSGIAEINGNDFIVSLAADVNDIGTAPNKFLVGGTFMHELGHNLGLRHGGGSDLAGDADDTPTHKPNYLSVMNLLYQKSGIVSSGGAGTLNPPYTARLDYSTQTLPRGGNTPGALDERDLDEAAGLGSGTADIILYDTYVASAGACPTGNPAPSDGPVDWDGDGVAGDNLHAGVDLNRADHPGVIDCPSSVRQVLKGHTDWGPAPGQSIFVYKFQCTSPGKD